MNKFASLLFFLLNTLLYATPHPNNSDYTYRRDLKVANVYQLTNQVFVPQEVVEGVNVQAVDAGKVRILVGSDMVAFKGVDGLTAFGIISKIRTGYGYELKLVDSRGSDFSKLAIEIDTENYVESLFFESKRYGDFEFRLPQKSTEQIQSEKKYYTPKNTHKVFSYSDLDGVTLKPYKRINLQSTAQREEKIAVAENFNFVFNNKKITINTQNQSKTLKVKKASIGLEKINGNNVKVLQIKTNKRSENFNVYLDNKNQIITIKNKTVHYFFM